MKCRNERLPVCAQWKQPCTRIPECGPLWHTEPAIVDTTVKCTLRRSNVALGPASTTVHVDIVRNFFSISSHVPVVR